MGWYIFSFASILRDNLRFFPLRFSNIYINCCLDSNLFICCRCCIEYALLNRNLYCKNGDNPNFKLYRSSFDELVDLDGNFESWSNNLISYIGTINGLIFAKLLKENNISYIMPFIEPLIIIFTILLGYFMLNDLK